MLVLVTSLFFFFLTLDHTDDFHIGQVQATAPKEPALASGPHLPDVCTKSILPENVLNSRREPGSLAHPPCGSGQVPTLWCTCLWLLGDLWWKHNEKEDSL